MLKSIPDISTPTPLPEDYVKDVKDAKPISADYQKYTLQDVRMMVKHKTNLM